MNSEVILAVASPKTSPTDINPTVVSGGPDLVLDTCGGQITPPTHPNLGNSILLQPRINSSFQSVSTSCRVNSSDCVTGSDFGPVKQKRGKRPKDVVKTVQMNLVTCMFNDQRVVRQAGRPFRANSTLTK